MRSIKSFLLLGGWLIILPFLGVPGVWKERLMIATGCMVIVSALYVRYWKQGISPTDILKSSETASSE